MRVEKQLEVRCGSRSSGREVEKISVAAKCRLPRFKCSR